MVVGNILGNKNWVRIQFNQNRFEDRKQVEHSEDIEENIWKEVYEAHKILFSRD